MTIYAVSARRGYRGHQAGSSFEARLDPLAEQRALERGDIQIVEASTPAIQPGTFSLPVGWANQKEEVQ